MWIQQSILLLSKCVNINKVFSVQFDGGTKVERLKTLTTSTLCLPGGWGMEYLMKPWEGKGYKKQEMKTKKINESNALWVSVSKTSSPCRFSHLGSVWSTCTPNRSVWIELENQRGTNISLWKAFKKQNDMNKESDLQTLHCKHQVVQAVADPELQCRGFSPEWLKKIAVGDHIIAHAVFLTLNCVASYEKEKSLKRNSKYDDYLWGGDLLSGACIMRQVMKEGLKVKKINITSLL